MMVFENNAELKRYNNPLSKFALVIEGRLHTSQVLDKTRREATDNVHNIYTNTVAIHAEKHILL